MLQPVTQPQFGKVVVCTNIGGIKRDLLQQALEPTYERHKEGVERITSPNTDIFIGEVKPSKAMKKTQPEGSPVTQVIIGLWENHTFSKWRKGIKLFRIDQEYPVWGEMGSTDRISRPSFLPQQRPGSSLVMDPKGQTHVNNLQKALDKFLEQLQNGQRTETEIDDIRNTGLTIGSEVVSRHYNGSEWIIDDVIWGKATPILKDKKAVFALNGELNETTREIDYVLRLLEEPRGLKNWLIRKLQGGFHWQVTSQMPLRNITDEGTFYKGVVSLVQETLWPLFPTVSL